MSAYRLNPSSGRVLYDVPFSETGLQFGADDIRRERTGVHARVFIGLGNNILAFNNFNVERDEDRTRLANSAFAQLPDGVRDDMPKGALKRHLDIYCFGLWNAYLDISTAGAIEDLAGDASNPPARPILPHYIYEDAGTILQGREGGCKTYTALTMGIQCDAAAPGPFGVPTRQAGAIFINLERSKTSLATRIAAVNKVLGLEANRPLTVVNARGRPLTDLLSQIHRTVERQNKQVAFLDSLSRTGPGSLVADDVATAIINNLNSLGIAWFAIGHAPRGDETHVFGSVHFTAGADIELSITSELVGLTRGVSIAGTKANDVPLAPRRSWAFEFKEDVGLVAVRAAKPGEFAEIESRVAQRLPERDRVADFLKRGAATVSEIAEATGVQRPNVYRVVRDTDRFAKVGSRPSEKGQPQALYGLLVEGVSKAVSDTPSDTEKEVYQTPFSRDTPIDTPSPERCRRCDLGINSLLSPDHLCGSCREFLAVSP